MDAKKKNFCALMGVALGISCYLSVQANLKNLGNGPAENSILLGGEKLDSEKPGTCSLMASKQSRDKTEITDIMDKQETEREVFILNRLDDKLNHLGSNADELKRKFDNVAKSVKGMFRDIVEFEPFGKNEGYRAIFDNAQDDYSSIAKLFMVQFLNKKQSSHSEGDNKQENSDTDMREFLKKQQNERAHGMYLGLRKRLDALGSSYHEPGKLKAELVKIKNEMDESFDVTNSSKKFNKSAMCRSILALAQKKNMPNVVLFGAIEWDLKKDTEKSGIQWMYDSLCDKWSELKTRVLPVS